MENLTKKPSFWEGVSHSTWARLWWHGAFDRGEVLDLQAPAAVHKGLIVQFATDPRNSLFYAHGGSILTRTNSDLAVWRMVLNQQTLQFLLTSEALTKNNKENKIIREEITLSCDGQSNIDYRGIDGPIQAVVKDMIRLSGAVIKAYCDENIEASPALKNYVESIREYLQYAGLAGWVACRCATNLIHALCISRYRPSMSGEQQIEKDLLHMANEAYPFFEEIKSNKSKHLETLIQALSFFVSGRRGSYLYHPYGSEAPSIKFVRLEQGRKPVELIGLFAESIRRGGSVPFDWMLSMPFPSEFIRLLVEKYRDHLLKLLVFIGERYFMSFDGKLPLRIQDTQRILKAARGTDDPNILAGVATALMNAKFLRISEPELLKKILLSASKVPFATRLFRVHKIRSEERGHKSFDKEIKLVEQVAKGVLDAPEKYTFKTVSLAADFLAEHQQLDFLPLLDEENNLGI